MVRVPPQAAAASANFVPELYRRGLKVSVPEPWGVSENFSPRAGPFRPKPGQLVRQGTTVAVSMDGLVGFPSFATGTYTLPNLVGVRLPSAIARLKASGLRAGASAHHRCRPR